MKKWFNTFVVVTVMTVMVACGNKLTSDNFAKIKNGMTEEEVKSLLGKPSEVKSGEMLGLSSTTFTYKKGESSAVVGFINGKVTHRSGSFE
ncbi:MAG: outer membrane protein assembly factor BamE [Verrucomicrobiota bacterium]